MALHTCNVEHRLKSQSKSSNFQDILLFAALVNLAEWRPVVALEHGAIPSIEGGALVWFKVAEHDIISRMLTPVD